MAFVSTTFNVTSAAAKTVGDVELRPLSFAEIEGFDRENFLDVWTPFVATCRSIASGATVLRPGRAPDDEFRAICRDALSREPRSSGEARHFFETRFRPYRLVSAKETARPPGFLTGYYEPLVEGSLTRSEAFAEPLLSRPDDLVTLRDGDDRGDLPAALSAGRRKADGSLEPYPTRAAIDGGALGARVKPVVWVRDAIEAFMIQVQGSAAARLPDGEIVHLTYAGRNGRPYTSIGRILMRSGEIPEPDMSLHRVKQWVRDHGQALGEAGRALLFNNESYVFFQVDPSSDRLQGPIGAASVPLAPLRSIAVDRNLWPYGLPFWIDADLPWRGSDSSAFHRLMIAQDTGTAIVGPARVDIFFGSGAAAGTLAGGIRHPAQVTVFLPRAGDESAK